MRNIGLPAINIAGWRNALSSGSAPLMRRIRPRGAEEEKIVGVLSSPKSFGRGQRKKSNGYRIYLTNKRIIGLPIIDESLAPKNIEEMDTVAAKDFDISKNRIQRIAMRKVGRSRSYFVIYLNSGSSLKVWMRHKSPKEYESEKEQLMNFVAGTD